MTQIDLSPYDPKNGVTSDANAIQSAFSAIQAAVNALDNSNISASAAISLSKLAGYPTDADQVPLGDGSWGRKIYRKTTAKAVNTTTAATDLLNGEITIAGGAMGTNRSLRVTAWGDRLQNSGGTAALPRFQVVFGGSTILDTGTPGGLESASAVRCQWSLEALILNTASNAQVAQLSLTLGSQGGIASGTAGFTTGTGTYQNIYTGISSVMAQATGVGTGTVDTTAAKALALNVINGSANAAYETKLIGALVEVI